MGHTWSSALCEAWPSEHFRGGSVNAEHGIVLKLVWRPRDEHSKWEELTTSVTKHDSGSWSKNKVSVCMWGVGGGVMSAACTLLGVFVNTLSSTCQGPSTRVWSCILAEDEQISGDPPCPTLRGFCKPPVQRSWLWAAQSQWQIASAGTLISLMQNSTPSYRWGQLSPEFPCVSGIAQTHNSPLNFFFFLCG